MTWVLTRDFDDANDALAQLLAQGLRCINVPCVEFAALPWPKWPTENVLLFFTSRRAVRAWREAGGREARIAAIAPATQALLEAQGVAVWLAAEGGSVALARAAVEKSKGEPPRRVLYPVSDAGLATEEHRAAVELLAQIGPVEHAAVYRTRAAAQLSAAFEQLPPGPLGWHFASPSAVEAWFTHASSAVKARTEALVCSGESTFRACEKAGASTPTLHRGAALAQTFLELERKRDA